MSLQWFRASLVMGHVGAGKGTDETVYIEAPNTVAAMDVASEFPGAKKSRQGTQGNSITPHAGQPPGEARKWYW